MTEIVLSERELNALELVLGGLLPAFDGFAAGDVLLDREQTPVARVLPGGAVEPLRPMARRPFQERRIIGPDVPAGDAAGSGELVVVLDAGDHEALSRAVSAARAQGASPFVLPLPPSPSFVGDAVGRVRDDPDPVAVLLARAGVTAFRIVTPPPGPAGLVVFFTGLSGSGKSTIARALAERLRESDERIVTLLDGDEVRTMLSAGLGFSREDRELNIRRIAWVAALAARHGGIAICAPIAPYAGMRADARARVEAAGGRFVLVHVSTPLEVCEARDRKGLYAKARAGELKGFTGIDDPYEVPLDAELTVDAGEVPVDAAVELVLAALADRG